MDRGIFICLIADFLTALVTASISCPPFREGEKNEIVYSWNTSNVNQNKYSLTHNHPLFDLRMRNGTLSYLCSNESEGTLSSSEHSAAYCKRVQSSPLIVNFFLYLMGNKTYLEGAQVTWKRKVRIPSETDRETDNENTCNITYLSSFQKPADNTTVRDVAVGVSCVVVVIIFILIVFVWWRKRNKRKPENSAREGEQTPLGTMTP